MGTVSYKNQPGIDATKGNVPMDGTDYPYTVLKVLWPEQVERFVGTLLIGESLHVCCGKSKLGTVRLDLDEANNPDIICNAADMTPMVKDRAFDTVLCDPPYNGDMQWNHDLLRELHRVARKRIVFQHWFVPADENGRYKKAKDGWGLTALYAWMPRTYFGRVQVISVFDFDNLQPNLFYLDNTATQGGQSPSLP